MKKLKLGLLLKISKTHWALIPQMLTDEFQRKEPIHLPIIPRTNNPLVEDYENAAGVNPVLVSKGKNLILLLANRAEGDSDRSHSTNRISAEKDKNCTLSRVCVGWVHFENVPRVDKLVFLTVTSILRHILSQWRGVGTA